MKPKNLYVKLITCVVGATLAACSSLTPTAAPLPTPLSATQSAATPTLGSVPTDTVEPPTPTASAGMLYYLGAQLPDAAASAAQQNGWKVEQHTETTAEAARAAAQAGASVVLADGLDLASVARDFPQTYFIALDVPNGEALPNNLLVLGGPGNRQDQAGFLAGMVAGFATQTERVAVVSAPTTPAQLKYRNGFQSGVRYACPKCRQDAIDLRDMEATEFASAEAVKYVSLGVDVLFAAPGPAGEAALTAAAKTGAWVIGAADAVPAADKLLTSVFIDPGAALASALNSFNDGAPLTGAQPLSLANNGVSMTSYTHADDVLSPLDRQDIEAARARLASGALETGVDPLTGAER